MKIKVYHSVIVAVLFVFSSSVLLVQAADPKKVACVGDSITFGAGVKDRGQNSYPVQLGKMLGAKWQVKNYGVNAATLLKKGDKPYWKLAAYQSALKFEPDVVIIKLGTTTTTTTTTVTVTATPSEALDKLFLRVGVMQD